MTIILESLVGSCAKKLQELVTEEAISILRVKEELEVLQKTMKLVQCFLYDAEKQRTEKLSVNNWLGQLKDAMYEADDIIDLARFEGNKLLANHASPSRNSFACANPSFLYCLPNLLKRREIAIRIRKFNSELEEIWKLGQRLELQSVEPQIETLNIRQLKTLDLVEPNLVGKEISIACTKLVDLIFAHKENKVYKIGIVGTGGVGKTALAQKIYNDHRFNGIFNKKAWICVSNEYSDVALLKEVLRDIGEQYEQDETVTQLGKKLAENVKGKSIFLVLDDVWQHEMWTRLLKTPLDSANTIIILVTTRSDIVARAMGVGVEDMHRVELLPEEVGWELLWRSMDINDEIEVQDLRDTGMEIVRMCGGLPLAIKVTASVLATKEKNEIQWRKVITNSAWSMTKLPVELRGALYLSYDDLPHNLKHCFLYCGLYPEDWSVSREDIIRCWIAEGFVEEQQEQLIEETAEEYYNELIHRNLLQKDNRYIDYYQCKMHDLLRQLARHLMGEEFFGGDPQSLEGKSLSRLRRISVVPDRDSIMFPNTEKQKIGLRTWMSFMNEPAKVENTILERIPRIRILDWSDLIVQSIPSSVGNLIHLRLLDLDRTDISFLPESIGSLMNLQILNLQGCKSLHSLPLATTKLCNLRRLGLSGTPINQVPKGIGRLKFLNDLEGIPISGGSDKNAKMQDGWILEELDPLKLVRRLDMIRLERASLCSTDSLLTEKKYLKIIHLNCSEATDKPYDEADVSINEKIFTQLIPPNNLEDLCISGYFGRMFPSWLGSTTQCSSLMWLKLVDCKSCVHIPSLGQLSNLKYLRITGMTAVTKIGPEFAGYGVGTPRSTEMVAFPKLEWLYFEDMPNWGEWSFIKKQKKKTGGDKEWEEGGVAAWPVGEAPPPKMRLLPRLKELVLVRCPKLRSLPRKLCLETTNLKELHLRHVDSLNAVENLPFLSETLLLDRCENLQRVSNIPLVRELRVHSCPNMSRIELDSLQEVWLDEDMREVSSQWLPGLQKRHQELRGQDLEIFNWL